MPTNIIETATKGSTLSVPVGTDKRKASSLTAAWQAIANRLLWLETFVSRIAGAATDVITTGLLVPVGNITLRLTTGGIIFDGNDDYNIHLGGVGGTPGGVQLFANGNMGGHMFTKGRSGRANLKRADHVAGGGPYDIDPSLYNLFKFTPDSAIVVNIDPTPAYPYKDGDTFRVCNLSTTLGRTIAIKRDSGAVTVFTLAPGVAGGQSFVDIVYDDAGTWSECGSNRLA